MRAPGREEDHAADGHVERLGDHDRVAERDRARRRRPPRPSTFWANGTDIARQRALPDDALAEERVTGHRILTFQSPCGARTRPVQASAYLPGSVESTDGFRISFTFSKLLGIAGVLRGAGRARVRGPRDARSRRSSRGHRDAAGRGGFGVEARRGHPGERVHLEERDGVGVAVVADDEVDARQVAAPERDVRGDGDLLDTGATTAASSSRGRRGRCGPGA